MILRRGVSISAEYSLQPSVNVLRRASPQCREGIKESGAGGKRCCCLWNWLQCVTSAEFSKNAERVFLVLFSFPGAAACVSVRALKRCVKTVVTKLLSRFVVITLIVGEIMEFSRKSELKYSSLNTFSLLPLPPVFAETNSCKCGSTHAFISLDLSFLAVISRSPGFKMLGKRTDVDQILRGDSKANGTVTIYRWPRSIHWYPKV